MSPVPKETLLVFDEPTPAVSDRVRSLHAEMTLDEKLAQLVGFWVDQGDDIVAPLQGEMATSTVYADASAHGLGHLTRVYGTRPVDPVERAQWLWSEQKRLRERSRLGIPAIVHEECLTGLAAWQAATFPTPLAWGAAFDPDLVGEMAQLIGQSMRELGIHQGLAPVLDVVRDPRWGRVDECISEDPYVVGVVGTAYVRGLQSQGVHATLKHFVGYSGSQAGRNHAPVHAGPREIADVYLPPFEMAVIEGGARSVMNSYAEIDGIPAAATPEYLTDVLRRRWGFDGVTVADYFSVAFLHTMHQVAADRGQAAVLALRAGVDVELPTGDAFTEPLREVIAEHPELAALVDRAVLRVLSQKEELGLLDETFDAPPTTVDLDSPAHRDLARRLAEESAVLLRNDALLPLGAAPGLRLAVSGPNADSHAALMGCYSFANHVLAHHPATPLGFEAPSVLDAIRERFTDAEVTFSPGCAVEGEDRSGFAAAVDEAAQADVAVVVVGDSAGLFGRGTVGEGNDVSSLDLPGVQRELVAAIAATGTPVVLVVLSGRPYALDWALDGPDAVGAVVQSFFPGEEGGRALARILAGDVSPSGRLPVSLPRSAGAQPYSYLHPLLGGPSEITTADSTPLRPFGFGLSYTSFRYTDLAVTDTVTTDGHLDATVTVTNTGSRGATDVVQLYARTPFRSTTRPVAQLIGFHRVALQPGQSAVVAFDVPSGRFAAAGADLVRRVEPGEIELWVGTASDRAASGAATLVGDPHEVALTDRRVTSTRSLPAPTAQHQPAPELSTAG